MSQRSKAVGAGGHGATEEEGEKWEESLEERVLKRAEGFIATKFGLALWFVRECSLIYEGEQD